MFVTTLYLTITSYSDVSIPEKSTSQRRCQIFLFDIASFQSIDLAGKFVFYIETRTTSEQYSSLGWFSIGDPLCQDDMRSTFRIYAIGTNHFGSSGSRNKSAIDCWTMP